MSWSRSTSASEQLMVEVLAESGQSLTLDEIVEQILLKNTNTLTGNTPKKSLYSVIYRREKRRKERGQTTLFLTNSRGGATYYSLNQKVKECAGERILEQ